MASLEVGKQSVSGCFKPTRRRCTHRMRSEPTLNDHCELMRTACRPYDVCSLGQSTAMIACCCGLMAIRLWSHCSNRGGVSDKRVDGCDTRAAMRDVQPWSGRRIGPRGARGG
jgi:hypothetical protein